MKKAFVLLVLLSLIMFACKKESRVSISENSTQTIPIKKSTSSVVESDDVYDLPDIPLDRIGIYLPKIYLDNLNMMKNHIAALSTLP